MSIIRDITRQAQKFLSSPEVLLFIGARQAGKTTILHQLEAYLEQQGEQTHFLNLEDPDYLSRLNESPKNLWHILPINLEKKAFIFIDEIQYLNNPSNFLKYFYDEYKDRIKILASGSSAFYIDKKFKDSLAGRKKIFYVRTLSFREFLNFKNEFELGSKNFSNLVLQDREKIILYYQEYLKYGGYPKVVLAPPEEKRNVLTDIAYSYIKKDIFEARIKQDEIFYKLFKILASNIGQLVNASELASTLGVSKSSIDNYLYVMRKSFHVHLLRPFFKNIRKELTKMPKVYFYDLGLRNFFVNNFSVFETRADKGALLENAVFRQLIEQHEVDDIKFWRTIDKHEVDFILSDSQAIEVKTKVQQFNKKKYDVFFQNYPTVNFELISFNSALVSSQGVKIKEVWEL